MTAPDKFFRHKIMTMFDPPPGTDELRREILDDTLSAFLEMRPVDDENEPVWRELLRTHRGRRWPLACDLTRALGDHRRRRRAAQHPLGASAQEDRRRGGEGRRQAQAQGGRPGRQAPGRREEAGGLSSCLELVSTRARA